MEYISFNSFCNKEIAFQFESVHVHIWVVLTNKQLSDGRTTGNSTGNPTGDSTYIYILENWRQFKQLKNCQRHTHRTPNTCKLSLKFFWTIWVETCHFPYLKNHTSISFNKKKTIKSNFFGKTPYLLVFLHYYLGFAS